MHPRRDPAVGFLNVPRRGTFRSSPSRTGVAALPPGGAAPTFWVLESNGPMVRVLTLDRGLGLDETETVRLRIRLAGSRSNS